MLSILISMSWAAHGTVEQEAATSPGEKIRFASIAIDEMWSTHAELAEQLRGAEAEPDRATCLDSKLNDLEHLIREAESATVSIPLALAEGERQLAELEFRKVSIALSRSRQARQAAALCGAVPIEQGPEAPTAASAGWAGAQLD